jgi:hypothetical protein
MDTRMFKLNPYRCSRLALENANLMQSWMAVEKNDQNLVMRPNDNNGGTEYVPHLFILLERRKKS